MTRITLKQLELVVERINSATGSPPEPYSKLPTGEFKANIGCYHLDGAYSGWALYKICSSGGACNDIFRVGHVPKRELYELMHAYLLGIEQKKGGN